VVMKKVDVESIVYFIFLLFFILMGLQII